MSLLGVILLVVNVVGYFSAWRCWIRIIGNNWWDDQPNRKDFDPAGFFMGGLIVGSMVALAWPFILTGRRIYLFNQKRSGRRSVLESFCLFLVTTRADRKSRKVLAK